MPEGEKPAPRGDSYTIGDVGAGARVQQGKQLTWTEAYAAPGLEALRGQFEALLREIEESGGEDEATKAESKEVVASVAQQLARAGESPGGLKQALFMAKGWFGTTATWVWARLRAILTSEAAQKTLATITEASAKAAIQTLIRGS